MSYQSLQNLLRPTTLPDTANFLDQFYTFFDSGGVHRKILNVEPLYYYGDVTGTEFLVYSVNKLYICYSLNISTDSGANTPLPNVQFFNEANTSVGLLRNASTFFDGNASAVRYEANNAVINNIYFSRATFSLMYYWVFNGYRITLN
jgi:hypothetical protein